jgi:hypothetical protein
MSGHINRAQTNFLMQGGAYQFGLAKLQEDGVLATDYVYHEYPRIVRLSRGIQTFKRSTDTCDKRVIEWEETKEVFEDIVVHSEEEEERVTSGGKSSVQMEEDRLGLLQRARNMGIPADPKWSAVRLRRELGEALDAPAPGDEMAKLEAELASLRKMAAMQAEIDALKAQIGGKPVARSEQTLTSPLSSHHEADEIDELRSQLTALGVEFHHRHGAVKLRELLDMATAPEGAR